MKKYIATVNHKSGETFKIYYEKGVFYSENGEEIHDTGKKRVSDREKVETVYNLYDHYESTGFYITDCIEYAD